ncbi:MAG: DNA repair protein [Lachnospiraceae bacterium]|nr:DNA repair protein [Lachnospiraceae bacterium]
MTDKELRKLNRAELLEILIEQIKENKKLSMQLDEANRKLNERKINIENSGSIAEAALKLNGVFEAAEMAAQQYVESVKIKYGADKRDFDQDNLTESNLNEKR